MKLKVLGIDPGTATIGWAVLSKETGSNFETVAYGHIETSPEKSEEERILEIGQDIDKIVKKYKPQEAALEKLFFFKNKKTIIEVSQARGAIILALGKNGVSVSNYTPLQLKQSITGYGKAEKNQIQYMTKKILELSSLPKPDDTADALAIAICHINSRKNIIK